MAYDINNSWVFDLEANGLLDVAHTVWCGVFRNLATGEVKSFTPDDEYYLHYMLEFMDSCDVLIGHNIHGYDFPLLKKLFGYEYKGAKIDTLVWSKMLQPHRKVPWQCPIKNKPHSVETWGYRVGRGKPSHDDWSQYSKEMLHRCSEDTAIQVLIYQALLDEMQGYDWEFASWLNNRLFDILGRQEQYGWKVDVEWMDHILHTTERWISKIDKALAPRLPLVLDMKLGGKSKVKNEIAEPFKGNGQYCKRVLDWCEKVGWNPDEKPIVGPFSRVLYRPLDPSKRMEAIPYLLDAGWIPKEWNTNDAGERTSPKLSKDDPFDGVEGREGNLLAKRMQIRHRQSSVNGLKKLIRPDGRIAGRVASLAETGRMTHAGIVNIPGVDAFLGKWMRKIFIADEGRTLVSVDSASCQDRMLAARVGNEQFTNTLLYGKKADKSTIHYVNQRHLAEAGYDVTYTRSKSLNFAFKFGGSDNKLGKLVGGTKDDGERARAALLKAAPGLEQVLNGLSAEWRSHAKKKPNKWGSGMEYYDGWIAGLDGRPINIDSEHKLLVYMLQSDEAIMMSYAYVLLYDWLEAEGFEWGKDWAYVCFYHDEYTIECLPEHVERIKQLGEAAIVAAGEFFNIACPHVGDGAVGQNWKEVH